jgi:hypothetical protein
MTRKLIVGLPATKTLLLRAAPGISKTNIPKNAVLIAAVAILLSCGGGGSGASTTPGTGASDIPSVGVWTAAGNPDGSCGSGIPSDGQPVNTSTPTTVVGTGTPASCTFAKLSSAITTGGVITFNCGASPVTIPVTATLNIKTDRDTIIDGKQKVILDGQKLVRIMSFNSNNFQANEHRLTLQHIALINGKATPTVPIQVVPPPTLCSQGWNDGEGGALYMQDGNLTVIDSVFTGNQAALLGPDTGGGAIYVVGSKHGVLIVGSTFTKNSASNAGAVGGLFADMRIYNSLFSQNNAVGNGANYDDSTKCSAINNGQHEVGSGGNGGAIYSDGQSVNMLLCGDKIVDNSAGVNAYGGGLFFTSNNMQGTLSIIDSVMTGNTGGYWTVVATGSTTNAGDAVGTNCKSLTIQNSTLQGL